MSTLKFLSFETVVNNEEHYEFLDFLYTLWNAERIASIGKIKQIDDRLVIVIINAHYIIDISNIQH
jgi:hypothetical protein